MVFISEGTCAVISRGKLFVSLFIVNSSGMPNKIFENFCSNALYCIKQQEIQPYSHERVSTSCSSPSTVRGWEPRGSCPAWASAASSWRHDCAGTAPSTSAGRGGTAGSHCGSGSAPGSSSELTVSRAPSSLTLKGSAQTFSFLFEQNKRIVFKQVSSFGILNRFSGNNYYCYRPKFSKPF